MAKSIATKAKKEQVNTEDRVMEGVVTATVWAEHNRRLVTLGTVALVAIILAGWAYVDYRGKMTERGAVRLDEIRMTSAAGAPSQQIQAELSEFISQFGSTPFAGEARLYLAQLELRADDLEAAIHTLEPAADLSAGTPVAFRAASSIAAAEEMAGRPDKAIQWYERIASEAKFDFQRYDALAKQARIHAQEGRLDTSEELYRQLLDAEDAAGEDQSSVWAIRLGEIAALRSVGGAYSTAPAVAPMNVPVDPVLEVDSVPEGDTSGE
jgi:predicted negative regulator of RcsB-dependent stress response